ncbi:disease resistance protein RGA4-like [Miscanthus floridulus]|uniref:disease resistance protein RGA4-like n=1 Tax=Miscanthus floridulus TaxID=154761 RepID=UPI00345AD2A2
MVAPLVGSLLGAVTSNVVSVVIKLIGKRYELWSDFDNDIESIRRDLLMIAGDEEDQLSEEVDLSAVMGKYREEMHDLALEIEDFLDRILRHVVEKNGSPLHKALGFTTEPLLDAKVKKLKERLKDAKQRRSDHDKDINGRQISHSSTPPANTYKTKIEPVGIDESKQEICEWATKDVEGEPEQLSVISIVGFSGSGKSTLAKAVYDCPDVTRKFRHRAWIVASKHRCDAKGLLMELLQKLGQGDKISDLDVEQLQAKISEYLKGTKRYLIVLDDIKKQTWWDGIKSAFPEKATGRIIVTTTIQRVAKVCSRGNGYVHNMEALGNKHSKELLKAVLKGHSPDLERSSTSIMNKCDGHPHALLTLANYLQSEDRITKSVCEKLCSNLGFRMATDDAFVDLQKVLMSTYRCLPKGFLNLKTCLLYVCVFPNGCHISRSRLIRRWSAEGYVKHDHSRSTLVVAEDNFKKLVDQSTIWPIDTSKNANVKTCRAHSIFHEFLLYMSMSSKFITSFNNEERKDYRHLFIQNTPNSKYGDDEEKSRAHSLTIYGSAGEAAGYFAKCQLLRVLDLEECKDLEDKHLDGIHKLWYLKYLSVGDKISRLPKHIEKLHCLETLDMRKTKKVIILPVEVIKLPHLAHLLGRFKLDKRDWDKSEPQKYVPEKSNLQTLAGFVTDNNPGFSKLMLYMKILKKVKICCNSTTDEGLDGLLVAIENFVQADLDTGVCVRSLSLDIGNFSARILRSLAYGNLRSLKLHGELRGLVQFTTVLWSLRELCLSSTNDLTEKDLSDLRKLSDLESLRLDGVSLEGFVITSDDFPGLLRLCLVQCASLPKIDEGALPNLLSLRLLNHGLDGLSGIEIKWHKILQEIALDSEVKQETKTDWEDAAKKHPKRPRVLYLKSVDLNGTGSMVKYVATERTVPATGSSTMRGKRSISRVESNSVDKPSSSDSKHVKREDDNSLKEAIVANPSPASTELCSAAMEMDIDMPPSSRVVS